MWPLAYGKAAVTRIRRVFMRRSYQNRDQTLHAGGTPPFACEFAAHSGECRGVSPTSFRSATSKRLVGLTPRRSPASPVLTLRARPRFPPTAPELFSPIRGVVRRRIDRRPHGSAGKTVPRRRATRRRL